MKKVFSLFLSALFLAACVGSGSNPALAGQTWQLVSYGSIESPIPAQTIMPAHMKFDQDGTFSGNMGCNDFSGEYRVLGSQLEFGEIMYFPMDCVVTEIMEQEVFVLGGLIGRLEYKISGDTLTIWHDSGSPALVFRKK
ncbi:MAG: META domain-containing protein [Anaerolineales bacterium]|nr:META domain-containing protein [Anaerolineales bacterium]